MTIDHRRLFSLTAILLIAASLVVAARIDTSRRVQQIEDLMAGQVRAIADIVAESSLHGLSTYNQWEGERTRRLQNNALWVAWADSCKTLDVERLSGFAAAMGLHRITIFDAGGARALAWPAATAADSLPLDGLPPDFLVPLIRGTRHSQRLALRADRAPGPARVVAGVARTGGGAVVVSVLTDSTLIRREEVGPGHLIKALGETHGIRYVVIQDAMGIQAASTDRIAFAAPGQDPALEPLTRGAEFVSREYDSELGPVLEVSRVVQMGPRTRVLLRVGIDSTVLRELRRDIRTRSLLGVGVLAATVLLVSFLLLAWQRQAVLDREVARVSAELRRKEEEARRAEKLVAMGSLAAGVAHQIRNPLNSIHMIAQVLERTPQLPADAAGEIRHIRDESGRIERIVQQFLHFARPRDPVASRFDLGAVLGEVAAVQAAAHRDGTLDLRVVAPALEVELDRQFVIEIVENLLRNAVQAVAGRGRVEVRLEREDRHLIVTVADDGPGVPAADHARIFDLYFTSRPEGSGLGLSLAVQMAEAMGGTLFLDERPGLDGRGARFVLRLPRQRSDS